MPPSRLKETASASTGRWQTTVSRRANLPVSDCSSVGSPVSSCACARLARRLFADGLPSREPSTGPNSSAYSSEPTSTVKTVTGR